MLRCLCQFLSANTSRCEGLTRQSSRAPEVVPNRGCVAEPSCCLRKSFSGVGEGLCQPVSRKREEVVFSTCGSVIQLTHYSFLILPEKRQDISVCLFIYLFNFYFQEFCFSIVLLIKQKKVKLKSSSCTLALPESIQLYCCPDSWQIIS